VICAYLLAKVNKILRLSNKKHEKSHFSSFFLVRLGKNKYLCRSF